MSDSQFQAPSLHNPAKNRHMVKIGEKKPVLDVEFNEMQQIQSHLRAELTRAMVYSGVLDFNSAQSPLNASTLKGQVYCVNQNTFWTNAFGVGTFDAIVNGNKVTVTGTDIQSSVGGARITLPDPPTSGYRDDLVFLEVWFEDIDTVKDPSIIDSRIGGETARRVQLNSRVRILAGADFSRDLNSVVKNDAMGGGWMNTIQPQGPNASPLTYDLTKYFFGYSVANNTNGYNVNHNITINDLGLWVAGDGTGVSKTALGTFDGYMYAIPLFRVKRRNSGGYSATNLNGAKDYNQSTNVNILSINGQTTGSINLYVGQAYDFVINETIPTWLKVGDELVTSASSYYKIINIDSANKKFTGVRLASVGDSATAIPNSSLYFKSASDRLDGTWSNCIEFADIIDLRRQVSLTGFNYQQLVDQNFDKLLRGDLSTKDKISNKKERVSFTQAPPAIQQQLMPVTVKGNDGISRDLTNVLGARGNCENTAEWTPTGPAIALDNFWNTEGKNSILVTNTQVTGTGARAKVTIDPTKYYLVLGDFYNVNMQSVSMYVMRADNTTVAKAGASSTVIGKSVNYAKVAPSDVGSDTSLYIYPRGNPTTASQQFKYDAVRIYEIDQATYNLIDVDANFTGDLLVGKFPYVSSYPNLLNNILPPFDASAVTNSGASSYNIVSPTELNITFVGSGTNQYIRFNGMDVKVPGGTVQTTGIVVGSGIIKFHEYANGVYNNVTKYAGDTWTLQSSTTEIRVEYANNLVAGTSRYYNVGIYIVPSGVTIPNNLWVPPGRWFVPYDYANGDTVARTDSFYGGGRTILSDAQTSETITEVIESLRTNQRHIKVTQATDGKWAVNDTIQVNSVDGLITGVIDVDTASVKVVSLVSSASNTGVIQVDDVSKIAVNDTFLIVFNSGSFDTTTLTVTSVDVPNKQITVTKSGGDFSSSFTDKGFVGGVLVETTTSSSAPVTTATGLVGTWSGMGTKTATFTITTKPTTDTDPIKLQYSVVYPAGKGISQVPYVVDEAKVNGERVVKASDGIVHVRANFSGKVSGGNDIVPHIVKRTPGGASGPTSLQQPSLAPNEFTNSTSGSDNYGNIASLDGNVHVLSNNNTGGIPQVVFGFDVIRAITDKLGDGVFADCITLADKIAKAKTIITNSVFNWWGYGSGPLGNKAYLRHWSANSTAWIDAGSQTSVSSITKLTVSRSDLTNLIDSTGFIYYVSFPDSSDGVTPSIINTDYVELELTFNIAETGYDVLIPDNQFPALPENILPHSVAYPVDTNDLSSYGTATLSIDSPGVVKVVTPGTGPSEGAGFSMSSAPLNQLSTVTGSLMVKGTGTLAVWTRVYYTDSTNDNGINAVVTLASPSTFVQVQTPPITPNPTKAVQHYEVMCRTAVSNQALTLYLTQPKVQKGAPNKVTWSPGRKKRTILNYQGKVAGSTFENPNKIYTFSSALPATPFVSTGKTDWDVMNDQTLFNQISKLDGNLKNSNTVTVGNYQAHMFEFDLSHLGLSLTELKNALRTFTINYTGFGSGDNAGVKTYGVTIKRWNANTSSWIVIGTPTASTPTLTTGTPDVSAITNDQKVYILVHTTYPTGATNNADLNTDYIHLQVSLADYVDYIPTTPVKVRKETKEVKLAYPMRANKYTANGDLELAYRYVPYQGVGDGSALSNLSILAIGKPKFTTLGTGGPLVGSPPSPSNMGYVAVTENLPLDKGSFNYASNQFAHPLNSAIAVDMMTSEFINGNTNGGTLIRVGEVVAGAPFSLQSASSVTPIRGKNYRLIYNGGATGGMAFAYLDKFLLNQNFVITFPILLKDSNGQLIMLVYGYDGARINRASNIGIYGTNFVSDIFNLTGKPLVKGGN